MTRYARLQDLRTCVGQEVGVSGWITLDQACIDQFAQATGDHQWIHVDPLRAAAGPFGATVAHGFLTLSLLPQMGEAAIQIDDVVMGLNYGLDKVRFPNPVRVDSRLRGRFVLQSFQDIEGGAQLTMVCTMEIEGQAKPACVAVSVSRRLI